MQSIFKRYEEKYLISRKQGAELQKIIARHMGPDSYGKYLVQTLYYDTENWDIIHASIEEKMRLRCYGLTNEESRFFLELKKKYKGIVHKPRVGISSKRIVYCSAQDIIADDSDIRFRLGYLFYAFLFVLLIGGANLLLVCFRFGQKETDTCVLKITIPENLDNDKLFDDIFEKYTASVELDKIKTVNMGSLYGLTYLVRLKAVSVPKALIDGLGCRNGNLNILISREQRNGEEL